MKGEHMEIIDNKKLAEKLKEVKKDPRGSSNCGASHDCKQLNLEYITLTGGEPLLHKKWASIAKSFVEHGVKVSLSTNGLLLTDKNIKTLEALSIDVQVSLDGGDDVPIYLQPGCGWAYSTAAVLSNGDVTICAPASGIDKFVAGNISSESFYNILNDSPIFNELRLNTSQSLEGICKICVLKSECLGGCRLTPYLKDNNINGGQPICQEYYNAVLDGSIKSDCFPIGCVKINKENSPL